MTFAPISTTAPSSPGLGRRQFVRLLFCGAMLNLLASGCLAWLTDYRVRLRAMLCAVLHKHLHGLGFTEQQYRRFAVDYVRHGIEGRSLQIRLIGFALPVYVLTDWLERSRLGGEIHDWSERVVGWFLLSTDYFDPTRDGSPEYLDLYVTYYQSCRPWLSRGEEP